MGVYHLPVVLVIEADSLEEAQNALEEWGNDVDMERDLPTGTEDLDIAPNCEVNDEGQRLMYLPSIEGDEVESFGEGGEDDDGEDDFNDGDDDF